MKNILRDLAELAEHLTYSHTFRSEKTQRRAHELLGRIRAELEHVPGSPETPAEQHDPGAEPLTPGRHEAPAETAAAAEPSDG